MKTVVRFVLGISWVLAAGVAAALPIHNNWAVLFSGGYDENNNRPRYYQETLRMWNITTGILGFNPANVYVLFADGTDPGADQCTSESGGCPGHVTSDWSAVTAAHSSVLSASRFNLENTLSFLSSAMGVDDSFYFWSFDHGGDDPTSSNPLDVLLNGWHEDIYDQEFAAWVDPLNIQAEIYAFGQCHSAGMVDDIQALSGNNRFAAWACAADRSSYGSGWADAWADGLESGLRWSRDLGQYALVNDIYGPNGTNEETPGYWGRNIHIVTNEIPAPPTFGLLASGLLGWFASRRKLSQCGSSTHADNMATSHDLIDATDGVVGEPS